MLELLPNQSTDTSRSLGKITQSMLDDRDSSNTVNHSSIANNNQQLHQSSILLPETIWLKTEDRASTKVRSL